MMNKKRLFLDMDGTLARFHDADKLFVEAMWTQGFYTGLKPFENLVDGVRLFIREHPEVDVYLLSAVLDTEPPFVESEKNEWLDRYLPEIKRENRIFTRAGDNKADYIGQIGPNDWLLDDYNKNLREFEEAGAHAIKFRNDVNHRGKGAYGGEIGPLWGGQMISYDSSPELIAYNLSLMICQEKTLEEKTVFVEQPVVENEKISLDEKIAAAVVDKEKGNSASMHRIVEFLKE